MQFYRIQHDLVSNPLADVTGEVHRQLDRLQIQVPQGDIAITAGSRGIDNIVAITKSVGDWLRERGARPFIVPSMGSHNGATAEGQRQMVESLGIREEIVGMDIRSSMDAVKLGAVDTGDIYMDRLAYESAGVVVLNRVKLHTCFSGPVQSGLTKMMVVGLGKIRSAQTFHSTPTPQMKEMLLEMGQFLLDSGKILAGVALLEDGYDQTAEIHALRPDEFLKREPELLQRHRNYFPRLPVDQINVLIVDAIGKTFSGTGMDTNVTGHRGVKGYEDLDKPNIRIIGALSLAEASHGNAIGVGLADFITQRLRDAIDEEKTLINVLTTGDMDRAKIPATLPDDQALFECIRGRYGDRRWILIPNTLHLNELYVSDDIRDELAGDPTCRIDPNPVELTYRDGRHQLFG